MERVVTSLIQECKISVSVILLPTINIHFHFPLSLVTSMIKKRVAGGNKGMQVGESSERKSMCEAEMCRGLSEHQYFSG